MRTIGVISDTHGLLRAEAIQALEGSDLIIHAGDVGKHEILDRLGRIAPVRAVYGNTDWGELRQALPETDVVDLSAPDGEARPLDASQVGDAEGPLAYVLHIFEMLDLDPVSAGFRVVIFGHTHEPMIRERGGVLYLNPGSAGPRRIDLPVTVARIRMADAGAASGPGPSVEAEIVDLSV